MASRDAEILLGGLGVENPQPGLGRRPKVLGLGLGLRLGLSRPCGARPVIRARDCGGATTEAAGPQTPGRMLARPVGG